jgi:hypothetical protein
MRYVTEVRPCQEAASPKGSSPSATPNAKRAIANVCKPDRPPRGSATIGPSTGAPARPQRWSDAVAELLALQAEYAAWCDALPDSLRDTATAEALQAIVDLDLDLLAAIEPPRGYGRD